MNYEVYLFACLLLQYDEEFRDQDYPEQYELAKAIYKGFYKSPLRKQNKPLEECMIDYIETRLSLEEDLDIDDLD
jgi:hypothetical protein